MRRYSLTGLAVALTLVVSLVVATSGAQAVVVSDQGSYFGVALVPGTRAQLGTAGIPTVTSSPPCSDPALAPELVLPPTALCSHGGAVLHGNETFALFWDQHRRYYATTKNYVEQFLRDVADGSNKLSSPYAVTSQYTDATGRATNASIYGGACTDFGSVGGAGCKFGNTNGTGAGHDYGANGCVPTPPNDICLTDSQLQGELATMITQTGVLGRTQPGYTPLLVLMTPGNVETCLDSGGKLCSANGGSTAQFCSYHSQVNVGGTEVAYVVQPWTALTACDEPDAAAIPDPVDTQVLATDIGQRLVSPLSQAQLAAIVNPFFNGWFALDGSEINDNGCAPLGHNLDQVTVGSSGYLLQREFNNAGVIETDPNALSCTPIVNLTPRFVVPSAVNNGDVVEFDGSTTVSSLIVTKAGYAWDFGDGTTAVGPSVVHSYAKGGTYNVKLAVIDRGANIGSLIQPITVLGPTVAPTHPTSGLHVHLQLLPQSLGAMLRVGVAVQVSSNERADGIATLSISRSDAKRAHLRTGRGPSVDIGRGTVSGIQRGTVKLHLRLSRVMAAKLKRLGHVTVTIRLALVAAGRAHLAVVLAGRY
jgi:hypothetical protein